MVETEKTETETKTEQHAQILQRHNNWLIYDRGWHFLQPNLSGNSPLDFGEFIGTTSTGNIKIKSKNSKNIIYFKEVKRKW